ncbi:MAG TPA: acyl-CoA dehydrogenase family protein, partial [Acidimicrobiia bacterium]|nr:acyl-CoA dehydrogenase family protein [Acidimicrobiia bacterium]
WLELHQFRLMVLHAAWLIDQVGGHKARKEIAACKVATAKVLKDIVFRAMHVHGSLGVSNEMPLIGMWTMAPVMGIADGPTEVHKVTIARQVLKGYQPSEGLWPSQHLPDRVAEAKARFGDLVDHQLANQTL